jgi:hypothetical protein
MMPLGYGATPDRFALAPQNHFRVAADGHLGLPDLDGRARGVG